MRLTLVRVVGYHVMSKHRNLVHLSYTLAKIRTYFMSVVLVPQSTDTQSIFSTRYSVMCKVYTGYCGTSEIEHGLCACMVDNPLAKARGLSLRTGAKTMLYLSLIEQFFNTASLVAC